MRSIIHGDYYRGYELNNCSSTKREQGFYQETLDRLNDLICYCVDYYSKACFVWFVLKFPSKYGESHQNGNAYLSKLLDAFKKWYCKEYKTNITPLFLWVREESSTGQIHYHVVVIVNGQRTQQGGVIWDYIYNLWNTYFPEDIGIAPVDYGSSKYKGKGAKNNKNRFGARNIDNSNIHSEVVYPYRDMYKFLSYYAKVHTKVHSKDPRRKPKNFSCSAIPRCSDTVDVVDLEKRGYTEQYENDSFIVW